MPDLPDLENQGWEQMKILLDRHLPQGNTSAPVASYTPSIVWPIAALWLAILFFTPVLIIDIGRNTSAVGEIASTTTHTADSAAPVSITDTVATEAIAVLTTAAVDGSSVHQPSVEEYTVQTTLNTHISPVRQPVSAEAANAPLSSGFTASSDSASIHTLDHILPEQQKLVDDPARIIIPAKPARFADKWALAVQVNRSLNSRTPSTDNNLYNLPVYPSFTASYYLNKKISISTGLAALAPGHLNKPISNRTDNIYIAGQPATPFAVTNKEEIKQTYYFQVPVTIDIHLKNHFILSAGVGLAFLHKALLQTDNNSNNLRDSSITVTSFRELLAPASIEAQTEVGKLYEIRQFDPRYLLGVSYEWRRFQLGLQYMRAIRPSVVSKYQPELNNHTELLNLHVGFQLFGPK